MIRKALHILIYRNRFFIPLVCSICLVILLLMVSFFSKIEARNRANSVNYPNSFVFNMPLRVMDDVLEIVVENEKGKKNELNFINIISLLAAKYDGDWGDYDKIDLKAFVKEFERGVSEKELSKPYIKKYKAFKTFYETIFKQMIGSYRISKHVDESGKPIFENKFGLKNYFPIAYDFDTTFLDDYEKENSHISSVHHLGIDLSAKLKTPIVAVESGIVKDCGRTRDFGWQIVVESFDGLRSYYYSNCYEKKPYAEGIEPDVVVKAGQVIGYVGATTCCTQKIVRAKNCPHLHFGMSLKFKNGGKQQEVFIDPYGILKFLQHHKSVVEKLENGLGFKTKYEFEDPVFEEYLKKTKLAKN